MSEPRAEKAQHAVTIVCEPTDYWPRLKFTCQAPPDATCRTICPNTECEEGCYHVGEPGHEREAVDYCNTVVWFEESDEPAGDIFGGPTSITAPILVSWERGEDGPLWRFAEHTIPPGQQQGGES